MIATRGIVTTPARRWNGQAMIQTYAGKTKP
jgi:hypothetical protein